jgi:tetratricopeptide (TPR) repeat protein
MTLTSTSPPPVAVAGSGPYKFLDYFEERDQEKFAGRKNDIEEVVARIARARTFVLFGRSGLGKTSLLLAGIFPRLRQQDSLPIYVRTLTAPLRDLFATVSNEAGGRPCASMDNLRAILAAFSERGQVVIVLDQFEEFFIRFRDRPDDRAEFIEAVAQLAHNLDLDLRIVFSLREDFLAELDDFRPTLPELFDNEYRLLPLTAFGAREAIVRPLIVADINYSRALVTRMIDELSEVGYDPPLLQIFCTEVYLEAQRNSDGLPSLEEASLNNVGGLKGIVPRYLNGVFQSIPPERMLLTRAVLDGLMTREETKRAATLESLLGEAEFNASEDEVREVLDMLVRHRLVRREWRDRHYWYELTHERLVPLVRAWLELDRDYFNFCVARDLVINSSRGTHWFEKLETLLNHGQLRDVIWPYRERLRLDAVQAEFLLRSAIYSKPDYEDISFWMAQYDEKAAIVAAQADPVGPPKTRRSHDILTEMLEMSDSKASEQAAKAARHFPDPHCHLARKLLSMAQTDPAVSIRRIIGQSLNVLCHKVERKTLPKDLFSGLGIGQGDRDVIADLYLGGLDVSYFSPDLQRQAYRLAVEIEPKNPNYLNGLAWNLCLLGRYEEALPHARMAARLLRGDSNIQDTLAHAEFGVKNYREAVAAWEAVLKENPGDLSDKNHIDCCDDQAHLDDARKKVAEEETAKKDTEKAPAEGKKPS